MTEENHREEIALLQLRLVEGALEESLLKTTDDRYVRRLFCDAHSCATNLDKTL